VLSSGDILVPIFRSHPRALLSRESRKPRLTSILQPPPENHSVHHQFDGHPFDDGDIPPWNRLLGTHRNRVWFTDRYDFPDGAEQRIFDMLTFRDVYDRDDV
jgi:hypothetical protein